MAKSVGVSNFIVNSVATGLGKLSSKSCFSDETSTVVVLVLAGVVRVFAVPVAKVIVVIVDITFVQ